MIKKVTVNLKPAFFVVYTHLQISAWYNVAGINKLQQRKMPLFVQFFLHYCSKYIYVHIIIILLVVTNARVFAWALLCDIFMNTLFVHEPRLQIHSIVNSMLVKKKKKAAKR